jgi:hypothetical protein
MWYQVTTVGVAVTAMMLLVLAVVWLLLLEVAVAAPLI